MSRPRSLRAAAVGLVVAALALTGCASASGGSAGDPTTGDAGYITPGKLTIATGETAYEPYVIGNDPASGKGYEAAVAYAVADKLGFAKENVEWARTSFEAAIAPGPKSFDFNIQQYTITDERKQAVDFSTPYYSASQAVVAIKGGPADGVTDIAGLKKLAFGAMSGSTSAQTIDDVIKPDAAPQLYNSNEDAVAALKAGQFDAFVIDLDTALLAVSQYIPNSFLIGALPKGNVADEWGVVLAKGSPLTAKVSAAIDELRADGSLDRLAQEWLTRPGVTQLQ
ncbi:ABC transporter substrate-binding protein [Microbacterium sp. CJ88]|uniref:ABC transporter substrate-binding protein n=1 Tax=Microbacterium sp. CJ88 TaxID=3445672 RepID=UPI003F65EDA4